MRLLFNAETTLNIPLRGVALTPLFAASLRCVAIRRRGARLACKLFEAIFPASLRSSGTARDDAPADYPFDIAMMKEFTRFCQGPACDATSVPNFESRPNTRGLYYNKERLLANGDRWERAIAKNISLDAPYR